MIYKYSLFLKKTKSYHQVLKISLKCHEIPAKKKSDEAHVVAADKDKESKGLLQYFLLVCWYKRILYRKKRKFKKDYFKSYWNNNKKLNIKNIKRTRRKRMRNFVACLCHLVLQWKNTIRNKNVPVESFSIMLCSFLTSNLASCTAAESL